MRQSKDWFFDVGFNEENIIIVDAYMSNMTHKRFIGLSREELIDLERKINTALKAYPIRNNFLLTLSRRSLIT